MSLVGSLICLVCSFVTCMQTCGAAPVPPCPGNDCVISTNPRPAANPLLVNLSLGAVTGTVTDYSAQRFTLPYAAPPVGSLRFAWPQPLTSLNAPAYDASKLPKACMQQPDSRYEISEDGISEDCLYLNIYRPSPSISAAGQGKKPVLVWVHGGSFVSGSSTAPGLDGSWLASKNNVIVVTIQYRLGMFGFFSPSAFTDESAAPSSSTSTPGNQGVRDAIQALQFVHDNIASFGGDPNSVTLAGQSSGAHLIRALLNAPSAAPLFQRAILHSDPANFGTQSRTTSQKVSDFALSQTGCSDLACLRSQSADDLLGASMSTLQAGQSIDPSVAMTEVFRPFTGALTASPFENDPSRSSSTGKPIIFTNVENESGSVVGSMLQPTSAGAQNAQMQAYPMSLSRDQLLGQMFNAGRSTSLSSAPQYSVDMKANDGLRQNLESILTQGMFTCPNWNLAQRYATHTPSYIALFERGISYPSNAGNDYCATRVCHEDDIQLVFSNPNKLSDASTKAVVKEVQARWVAFMRSGNPNVGQYGGWSSTGDDQQNALVLRLGKDGGAASSIVDTVSLQSGQYAGCGQVWGSHVKYDWQLYG
ncbi:Carboxylesterase, type B [Kalmanozyma brasiliensis GHG001]|uniref:Carboxylic ester hydrolase n=1 Tax=Kalmanozyma brasiliensis (strain GHG001) TaxID=1365824 RepID=V5EAE0_KALBG|nr:Carboxylesterase, type B [Kalmanozyma brasiliensis GHG001]EST07366.1 Carboxylesterase, type B [Kalmanozyma brasiliensis GHG001]